MLTVDDVQRPKTKSGYKYVYFTNGNRVTAHGVGGQRPYQAMVGTSAHYPGEKTTKWIGPRRGTAKEAAQDAVNYLNGQDAEAQLEKAALNFVHHKPREKAERTEAEEAAWKIIRAEREKRAKAKTKGPGWVYMLGEGVEGDDYWVKVGHSYDPYSRPGDYQAGNPRPLVVRAIFESTKAHEQELHHRFEADNIQGEWFRLTPELKSEFE